MREKLKAFVEKWRTSAKAASGVEECALCLSAAIEIHAILSESQWVPVTEPPTHTRTVYVATFDKAILGKYCPLRCKFCFVDSLAVIPGVTHWHEIEAPEPPDKQL